MKKIQVNVNDRKSTINKNIYGHFAEHLGRCIYNGIYVGEDSDIPNTKGMRNDIVEALKHVKLPVLRWPGGCFADEYHWKDGIGPKENRKKMVNTHWGGVVEDNSFGTHEFMELCRQIGCEPYINGNVGSGTVQEMSEWVEYLTFDGVSPMAELRRQNGQQEPWKVKYWGVGNENWGCGGNMRPEFYADLYRQFQTYVRNYGDNKIYKIACGANAQDLNWTEQVMKIAGRHMHALTLHYYTLPTGNWFGSKGSATDFDEKMYYTTLNKTLYMDKLISDHLQIMHRYDPENRVDLIVDEWGSWYDVEPGTNPGFLYQQNTMRDAMIAALNFNIFHKYSDRIVMTNIAQTINVLQAMVLTEGEKMLLTPTYHAYDLYKDHHDATHVYSYADTAPIKNSADSPVPEVSVTASVDANGILTISLVNPSATEERPLQIEIAGLAASKISGKILSGGYKDMNTFDNANNVTVKDFNSAKATAEGVELTMPACSIITLRVEK